MHLSMCPALAWVFIGGSASWPTTAAGLSAWNWHHTVSDNHNRKRPTQTEVHTPHEAQLAPQPLEHVQGPEPETSPNTQRALPQAPELCLHSTEAPVCRASACTTPLGRSKILSSFSGGEGSAMFSICCVLRDFEM